MFGEEHENEILKIPAWDNSIIRRIWDMFQDAESQVIANIKEADFFFAIHLDESTDITRKTQFLAFSKFVHNNLYFANHSQKQQKTM
jgi:hypothetical protein